MPLIDHPEDLQQSDSMQSRWSWIISIICILFAVFQIYTAGFGRYPNLIQRSIHAGFALILTYLMVPAFKAKAGRPRPTILSISLAVASAILCFYIVPNYDRLMECLGIEAMPHEMVMGGLLILVVLEAARRTTGLAVPIIAIGTLLYGYLGDLIPGYWGHPRFGLQYIIETLYLGPVGLWGTLTGISATLVAAFVIFGSILLTTGGAESFMKSALLFGGRRHGGAAKVATVGSAFFGMLSSSAIANVATTGSFTIPMMKSLGYKNEFAGGVEATASSGGQISPPIMGAGAFIMSELIGEPYLKIALAAAIPAFVFYTCVWVSLDLEARKIRLLPVPPDQIPTFRAVFNWQTSGPIFLTVAVLLASLFMGHTPTKAAFYAIVTNLGLFMFTKSWRKEDFLQRLKVLVKGFEQAGHGLVTVVSLLVCAQVVISMISLTGLGIKLSEMILGASGGHVFLALVLAGAVSLILGMGMPTTAAYVLAAAVVAPALKMMGIDLFPAHMFIFYWAIISALTPPVCTAVYTAATIAKAHWLKVAWVAIRLAIMKYIIPFFFIYRPSVLLIGRWYEIVVTIFVTWVSANLFAIGTVGYYRQPIKMVFRVIILAVALIAIVPYPKTDLLGIVTLAAIMVWQRVRQRSAQQGP